MAWKSQIIGASLYSTTMHSVVRQRIAGLSTFLDGCDGTRKWINCSEVLRAKRVQERVESPHVAVTVNQITELGLELLAPLVSLFLKRKMLYLLGLLRSGNCALCEKERGHRRTCPSRGYNCTSALRSRLAITTIGINLFSAEHD